MNACSPGGVIANREEAGVVLSCSLVRHALGGRHPVANAHVIPAYARIELRFFPSFPRMRESIP